MGQVAPHPLIYLLFTLWFIDFHTGSFKTYTCLIFNFGLFVCFMLQEELPSRGRFKPVFSGESERELKQYCTDIDNYLFGLTLKDVRRLAFDLAERNSITHPFDKVTGLAGRDWAYGFLKRCGLSLRQPEPTSIGRAMGFNKVQVDLFYSLLRSQVETHHFNPGQIFNMDESGMSTVPSRLPKVIAAKGKRAVNKIVSGERGQTITAVCCFSASGVFVPPALIFPRKRLRPELMDGAPAGSIGLVSDSGFINQDLFVEYLKHFCNSVRPSASSPVLLILDNHSSHVSVNAIDFCRANYIHMLSIPPHGSHKIQLLDVVLFGPLKVLYSAECDTWQVSNPGRAISQYQVARIFRYAYEKAATVEKATKGFKCTGIWPFDPTVFSDADFLPSHVTEVDMPAILIDNGNPNPPSSSPTQLLQHSSPSSQPHQPDPILPSLASPCTVAMPSTSSAVPLLPERHKITPEMIRPMPRCTTRRPGARKAQKATLITSSPFRRYRDAIEGRKSKSQPKLRTATKHKTLAKIGPRKLVKRNIFDEVPCEGDESTSCEGDESTLCDDNSDDELQEIAAPQPSDRCSKRKRPAPPSNALDTHSKKKLLPVISKRPLADKISAADNCLVCGEFGRGGELWFRCVLCSYWAHKACTSFDKPDNYVCDHCESD